MSLRDDERGPAANGAPPDHLNAADRSSTDSSRHRSAADPVTVSATAYRPSGRRHGWLLLVAACPYCSEGAVRSSHAHRSTERGGVRRSGCGRGDYRLVVDDEDPDDDPGAPAPLHELEVAS